VTESRQHLDAILLDPLPGAATVALLATGEVGIDRIAVEGQPRRQAGQDPDEGRPV
jgi:hypothetical protein